MLSPPITLDPMPSKHAGTRRSRHALAERVVSRLLLTLPLSQRARSRVHSGSQSPRFKARPSQRAICYSIRSPTLELGHPHRYSCMIPSALGHAGFYAERPIRIHHSRPQSYAPTLPKASKQRLVECAHPSSRASTCRAQIHPIAPSLPLQRFHLGQTPPLPRRAIPASDLTCSHFSLHFSASFCLVFLLPSSGNSL